MQGDVPGPDGVEAHGEDGSAGVQGVHRVPQRVYIQEAADRGQVLRRCRRDIELRYRWH